MTFTPVPTVATGDIWTASNHNTYIRDNLEHLNSLSLATSQNAIQKITENVLGINAIDVVLSSIPAIYRHLRLEIVGRSSGNVLNSMVYVHLNGDNGANYDEMLDLFNGTTHTLGNTAGDTGVEIGNIPGATAPANASGGITVDFFGYAQTTFQKTFRGLSHFKTSQVSGGFYYEIATGFWRSTAAINSIRVVCNTGSFVSGSIFSLYGLP